MRAALGLALVALVLPAASALVVLPGHEDGLDGFVGTYYSDAAMTQRLFQRVDAALDFDWSTGAPDADDFAARWVGAIKAPLSEAFTFTVEADGFAAMRLAEQGLGLDGTRAMRAEEWVCFDLTYVHTGPAAPFLRLRWESPSVARQNIPKDHTYAGMSLFFGSPSDGEVHRDGVRALETPLTLPPVVSGTVDLHVGDGDCGDTLELFVDGASQGARTGSPYHWTWDTTAVAPGQHMVHVVDQEGELGVLRVLVAA